MTSIRANQTGNNRVFKTVTLGILAICVLSAANTDLHAQNHQPSNRWANRIPWRTSWLRSGTGVASQSQLQLVGQSHLKPAALNESSDNRFAWHVQDDLQLEPQADDEQTPESEVNGDEAAAQSQDEDPLAHWPGKSIHELGIDIRNFDKVLPPDRSVNLIARYYHEWSEYAPQQKLFAWEPANIFYRPLYFEDVQLERYGQNICDGVHTSTPATHFFKSLVLFPFRLCVDPPCNCETPLGYCRPGK
jgi:hypothetical protein